ncbi:hypothetical protein V1477_002837 [Vespula maculifrons]|uniref:Uncharacterized protein n=1 Tax=Vespula maculifrons TaxID=7453 RepID=A0ABD2CUT6_VESMC
MNGIFRRYIGSSLIHRNPRRGEKEEEKDKKRRPEHARITSDPGPTAWRLLQLETHGLRQSNEATYTPDEFKPPNAKIAAPCVSAFGNRLTHSSTIQHRKLPSPLQHDRSWFRDKRRNPKLNPTALTNTYASIPETLTRSILDLIAPENTNAYASRLKRVSVFLARTGEKKSFYACVPRWSLGDATIAAPGNKRTNEDSTLKSTNRDAFPLRELHASQQTGDILMCCKYYRPRSHRLEVAASGDPRANGDSTLKFANQTKSITVGLLIAPENTTPVPADTRASVLPILPQSIMNRIFRRYIGSSPIHRNPRRGEKEEEKDKKRRPEHARIENLGKILKNAAIRSVILAVYEFPMYHKYFRPRSHRVEVAALWDPRANGESTLKSANRDGFPLRELRASQQTGDV